MWISLAHSCNCGSKIWIRARRTALDLAHCINPVTQPFGERFRLRAMRGRWPHALDRNNLADQIGKSTSIRESDNVLGNGIECARRPLAVAVAAKVERVHMIISTQSCGHAVPTPRVVKASMHEHKRRFGFLPIIPIVQLQAVREKKER